MRLKSLELTGFKSFREKTTLAFGAPVVSIVGPNGSGKSNIVEAFRFVLGEQSIKSMRGKEGADLIFKGSKHLGKSLSARVVVEFDNKDKIWKTTNDSGEEVKINYDTVRVGREVFPNGQSRYTLNDLEVRLKDIHNLLSSVNIGSSGHHIISQGEADRILNASGKDRREMIEDALGLKIYQFRIKDATRKLDKTRENMKEVGLLRRENAPHLMFLKKQVEKIERASEMRAELLGLYLEYFELEGARLAAARENILRERERIVAGLRAVREEIAKYQEGEKERPEVLADSNLREIEELRVRKAELERKLGRTEGVLEFQEKKFSLSEMCPLCGGKVVRGEEDRHKMELEVFELKRAREEMVREIAVFVAKEAEIAKGAEEREKNMSLEIERVAEREQKKFEWKALEQEHASKLEFLRIREENTTREVFAFENEKKEARVLVGEEVLAFRESREATIDQVELHEQQKKIERLKIRLEDAGTQGGEDTVKEYNEVLARDGFLERELNDLGASVAALEQLIGDLQARIEVEFKEGFRKINKEFQSFFTLMFGGGFASLDVVMENKKRKRTEEEEMEESGSGATGEDGIVFEQGVDINVSLPHKKVKELHALSGGERSLTSIALLFAMSQVNPPPFLVLDETDAALDESNSRKYGDMLERLSEHSQLLVVTHNRETMSRADELYGVTIGGDGASKLLSVKFEEAVRVAK